MTKTSKTVFCKLSPGRKEQGSEEEQEDLFLSRLIHASDPFSILSLNDVPTFALPLPISPPLSPLPSPLLPSLFFSLSLSLNLSVSPHCFMSSIACFPLKSPISPSTSITFFLYLSIFTSSCISPFFPFLPPSFPPFRSVFFLPSC